MRGKAQSDTSKFESKKLAAHASSKQDPDKAGCERKAVGTMMQTSRHEGYIRSIEAKNVRKQSTQMDSCWATLTPITEMAANSTFGATL